jgi:proteasome lid subunit RPN8/RPN11
MQAAKLVDYYASEGKERVGFIMTDGSIIEVENISPSPYVSASVNEAFLVENEDRLLASWHTHPGATSQLSADDYQAFTNWPDLKHYVVGNDGVSEYVVREGHVVYANEDRSSRSPT